MFIFYKSKLNREDVQKRVKQCEKKKKKKRSQEKCVFGWCGFKRLLYEERKKMRKKKLQTFLAIEEYNII